MSGLTVMVHSVVQPPSRAASTLDLTIDPASLKVSETHLGTRIALQDWLLSGAVGGPGLPVKTIWVALPDGMEAEGALTATASQTTHVTAKPTVLAPLRPPRHDIPDRTRTEIRAVVAVPEHYRREKAAPRPLARLRSTTRIGATSMVQVELNPVFFKEDGSLGLATQIQIAVPLRPARVRRDGGTLLVASQAQALRLADLARATVVNPADVTAAVVKPILGQTTWDYVILTDDVTWNASTKTPMAAISPGLTSMFQRLADWKCTQGLRARIVKVSDVVNSTATSGFGTNFMSGSKDLQQVIRKFLAWAHQTWGTAYVLLGGDQSIVPIRHLPIGSSWDKSLPTDLYYANLNPTNDWAENQPINLGAFDFENLKPDLSIGRVPVTNSTEATTFVNKVLKYEGLRTSGNYLNQDWLRRALYVSTKWGGDAPVEIHQAATFPPGDNQYYTQPGRSCSIVKLVETVSIVQDPNASTTSPGANKFNRIPNKPYYKIHLGPVYRYPGAIVALTGGAQAAVPWTDKAAVSGAGWYYTDWLNTDDGPCHDAQGKNYPTDWIIVYLAAGVTPQSFLIQLSPPLRMDYNLLSKMGPGDYRSLPYDLSAASTGRGWYFANSATDLSPSALDSLGHQVPTSWLATYATPAECTPSAFILDPAEEADTQAEQEATRKVVMSNIPSWNVATGLYPDVADLPAADRASIDAAYFTSDLLKAKIDEGQHIISIAGHGNPSCTCGGAFDLSLADRLTNGAHTGVLYANSCLTNRYTDDSLSRHLVVKNPNGGVCAYVGFLDEISIGLGHAVEDKFFTDLSRSGVLGTAFDARVGMITPDSGFDLNSQDVRYTIFMMGLVGDPALRVFGAGIPPWPAGHKINRVDSTPETPAVAEFGGKLYAFWEANDPGRAIYFSSSTDGITWPSGRKIDEVDSTPMAPSVCSYRNALHLFWRANDPGCSIYTTASTDGDTWPRGWKINPVDSTPAPPMPCVFQGRLYLFWMANDPGRRIYCSASADGMTWPNGHIVNDVDSTPLQPTACVFKNRLYLFWRANDPGHSIYFSASADGVSWPNGRKINHVDTSIEPPTACVYRDHLFVFWKASDPGNGIYVTCSPDGVTFPAARKINYVDSTPKAVSVTTFATKLYAFWKANDPGNAIYVSCSEEPVP